MYTTPIRLLIIEDCEGDFVLTSGMLDEVDDLPVVITWKKTYDRGLEAALADDFDVCLVDYRLGARTGCDLIAAATASGAQVPFVLLTGQGGEEVAVDAMRQGAKDYLVKDRITPEGLQRAIVNAVERNRLEHEVAERNAALGKANRLLQAQHRDLQGFYHTVSHELKNPLTAATEFASLLGEGLLGELDEDQRDAAYIIHQSCVQMRVMIDDLLDSSRLENGKVSLNRQPVTMTELVGAALDAAAPSAERVGISLHRDCDADLLPVHADPARIRQVLGNLISNAIKFTPQGGRVSVAVKALDVPRRGVRVTVADTGVGIPTAQLQKIFERFYQSDDGRDQAMGGLGLGLNICKGLVDLHGGQLHVESALGVGSTFSFTLSALPDHDPSEVLHA